MFTQKLHDTIKAQDRVQAGLARRIGLTPVEFYQKMVGYHGRRFSSQERTALAFLLNVPVDELFPDSVEAVEA